MLRFATSALAVFFLASDRTSATTEAVDPSCQQITSTRYASSGDIRLAYRSYGCKDHPALIVLNGVGNATRFEDNALTNALVKQGFRVIRMDNRDAGLSSRFAGDGLQPDNTSDRPAYGLEDMAADTKSVLDAEGIPAAHIMGISLGGMIAQVFASHFPDKTLSLISVSSTTGEPGLRYGPALASLQAPPAPTRELRIEQLTRLYPILEGTQYRMSDHEILKQAMADVHNDDPAAAGRQGNAAIASGDRTALLEKLNVNALVLHGSEDPLFPVTHAQATARAIPGAKMRLIEGMGHPVSDAAAEPVAEAISLFVQALQ